MLLTQNHLRYEVWTFLVVINLVGSLASATPNLVSSLEIGVEGVQYDSEGHHMIALEVIA